MGFFDWLFGKEKKPPEPLVLGAKLRCPYGSQDSYLYVDSEDIKINNLPKACVDDTKALFNILPFGDCYAGGSCETLMNLNNKWENPVPQGEKVNGKEIITTESLLACRVVGAEFKIISSGQDGIFAKQILFCEEMDQKYPGLREVLENPYGSLYLNKGMYNKAIKFIEDQTLKKGDIDLYTLFDEKNVEGNYLRSAFGHLLPYCDTSTMEGFVNGIQTGGVRQGISNDEGWNELKINTKTIEFLKKDCKETAHNIDTKPFYRWQEENKVFSSALADGVNTIAYAAIMYSGIKNISNGQSKYSKPVTQKVEAKGAGKTKYDNIKFDSLSGDDLVKVTTDIRNNGGSPVNIPEKTKVIAQSKNGYQQIKYKWNDGNYNYEARWHTETPGAAQYDRGTTWVVTKTTPGNANGVQKVVEVKVGDSWVNESVWNQAVKANQSGTATEAQKQILQNGHYQAK